MPILPISKAAEFEELAEFVRSDEGVFLYSDGEESVEISDEAHIIVLCAPSSRLRINDNISNAKSQDITIIAKRDSQVDYFAIQGSKGNLKIRRKAFLADGSRLSWNICTIGSTILDSATDTVLEGKGSCASYHEVFFAKESQDFKIVSNLHHKVGSSKADVLVKGILDGTSKSLFEGMIKIDKGADNSDSFLAQHTLMLSEDSKSDAVPALEIETDEVRCTHSASTSKIDDEHIFYLNSRGIGKDEAKKMLSLGFLNDVMKRQEFREIVEKELELKWAST